MRCARLFASFLTHLLQICLMKKPLRSLKIGNIMVSYIFCHRPAFILILLSNYGVPALQPDAEKETLNAALALFVCGCVASEKYALLSTKYGILSISKTIYLLIFNYFF